jgi:hypothetical protein
LKAAHDAQIAAITADAVNIPTNIQTELTTVNQEIIDRGHEMAAYSGAGKPTDAIMRL